jgi:hypothetical protein
MMVADVGPGSPPRLGPPRRLFELANDTLIFACFPSRCYDVSPDGQRFYVTQAPAPMRPQAVTHVNLAVNWVDELRVKVPDGAR